MENKNIIKALAEFQKLCPAIKKDSEAKVTTTAGKQYSYNYGSLPYIMEVIKPHLETSGLMFTQPLSLNEGMRCIVTTLYHIETGESIQSVIDIPEVEFVGQNIYQAMGSGITYLRRYALMSVLGIVAEEDDNDAKGEPKKPDKTKPAKPKELPELKPMTFDKVNVKWKQAVDYIVSGKPIEDIEKKYKISAANKKKLIKESDDILFPENK